MYSVETNFNCFKDSSDTVNEKTFLAGAEKINLRALNVSLFIWIADLSTLPQEEHSKPLI